jgi:hypothetical protein
MTELSVVADFASFRKPKNLLKQQLQTFLPIYFCHWLIRHANFYIR